MTERLRWAANHLSEISTCLYLRQADYAHPGRVEPNLSQRADTLDKSLKHLLRRPRVRRVQHHSPLLPS